MSRHTRDPNIPDVWPATPVVPPSRRYGATDELPPQPQVIDWLGGVGLVVAMIEEVIDFFGSDEWAHLVVGASL